MQDVQFVIYSVAEKVINLPLPMFGEDTKMIHFIFLAASITLGGTIWKAVTGSDGD